MRLERRWTEILAVYMGILSWNLTLQTAWSQPPKSPVRDSAADAVTLVDGSQVLGEFVDFNATGGVRMIVRRALAKERQPESLKRWEETEAVNVRPLVAKQLERMQAWSRSRETSHDLNDLGAKKLTAWIEKTIERLKMPEATHQSALIVARIGKDEIKAIERAAKGSSRLLRLGWLSELDDVEQMPVNDLKAALKDRAVDLKEGPKPLLKSMLPITAEQDAEWQLRRAATELRYDSGLRFLNVSGFLTPEPAQGDEKALPKLLGGNVKSLIDSLVNGGAEDPLPKVLQNVAKSGRVGAIVTSLTFDADLSGVSIEMKMWVRSAQGAWNGAGTRVAATRTSEIARNSENDVAQDPQVKALFSVIESLGLGEAVNGAGGEDLKTRSLKIGAATQDALGKVRALANTDLEQLAFPLD